MASFFLLASLSLSFLCNCHGDLISDVCSKALNPSLCTQTLNSDPRSRGADVKGLGQIVIEKAEAATNDAIRVVKSISTEKNKEIVDVCVETFKDAIDDLINCSQLLKKGSKGDLEAKGSGALTNVGTCDDEFEESEPPKVKMATKRAQDIIDILLVICQEFLR